ncbi:MAG: HEAT repeat domain-containing protein, partial [Rubripirellula sp.]
MLSADRENGLPGDVTVMPAARESAVLERQAEWQRRLVDDAPDVQLQTLVEIGRHSNVLGVSDLVIRLAGSRDDSVRAAAAQTLESSVQPSQVELPALAALLSDRADGEISYWAATLLGRLGQEAVDATPALCDCLTNSSFLPARERAVWALQNIGAAASDSIPALRAVSEVAPARLQLLCREAISKIGTSVHLVAKRAA